jgi:hypothetical protein
MAYIGRNTDKISNIEILDNITFDGSSSYSITKSSVAFTPNSAQSLLISIDGVVQATNFTVSSSTIDFGVAIPSTSTCDFFLHYGTGLITTPADGTVTEAKIGSGAVTSAKLGSDVTQGITEADQWRLTANITSDGIISTNLERVDEPSSGIIGTGMTESSGVFTFPSTGIWKVEAIMNVNVSVQDTIIMQIDVTIDNSSYNTYSFGLAGGAAAGGESNSAYTSAIIDVTDTANVKVRFTGSSISATNAIRGNTNFNETHFNFIRLGNT